MDFLREVSLILVPGRTQNTLISFELCVLGVFFRPPHLKSVGIVAEIEAIVSKISSSKGETYVSFEQNAVGVVLRRHRCDPMSLFEFDLESRRLSKIIFALNLPQTKYAVRKAWMDRKRCLVTNSPNGF